MSDAHTRVGSAVPFEVDGLMIQPGSSGSATVRTNGFVRLSSTQVDELIRALGGVPAGEYVHAGHVRRSDHDGMPMLVESANASVDEGDELYIRKPSEGT